MFKMKNQRKFRFWICRENIEGKLSREYLMSWNDFQSVLKHLNDKNKKKNLK